MFVSMSSLGLSVYRVYPTKLRPPGHVRASSAGCAALTSAGATATACATATGPSGAVGRGTARATGATSAAGATGGAAGTKHPAAIQFADRGFLEGRFFFLKEFFVGGSWSRLIV